jgi:alkylation response protein AidB-like acyl-CoA dehydrogenase
MTALPESLLAALANRADAADEDPVWPARSWQIAQQIGALRWAIPREFGGDGLSGVELLERYQELASACLTTAFILSQRDAACRRLVDSGNKKLCAELLPGLASGEGFATVGLSQLTTSRQHVGPSLTATEQKDGFLLNGSIPWVTGAGQAQHLLVGAVLKDGRQILLVMPTDLPGVRVAAPLDLMALQGSITAEVFCDNMLLASDGLLAGPAERVMQAGGRGGTGGLETSCLALGLARAALAFLSQEAAVRPPLVSIVERLERKTARLRNELERLAGGASSPEAATALRGRANALVLQAAQAALTASKGTGFVRPHPAQRWARQALFFLVWSCPWPAAAATLDYLDGDERGCG